MKNSLLRPLGSVIRIACLVAERFKRCEVYQEPALRYRVAKGGVYHPSVCISCYHWSIRTYTYARISIVTVLCFYQLSLSDATARYATQRAAYVALNDLDSIAQHSTGQDRTPGESLTTTTVTHTPTTKSSIERFLRKSGKK